MSGAFRAVSEAPTGGDEAWGRSLGDDIGGRGGWGGSHMAADKERGQG